MKILVYAIFSILTAMAGTVTYWLYQPQEFPVTISKSVATDENGIPKREFRVGERMFHYREGVIHTHAWRTTSLSIVSRDTRIAWVILDPVPGRTLGFPVGPFSQRYHFMTVPEFLPPGEYYIRGVITYVLNPLRRAEYYEVEPIPFRIIK